MGRNSPTTAANNTYCWSSLFCWLNTVGSSPSSLGNATLERKYVYIIESTTNAKSSAHTNPLAEKITITASIFRWRKLRNTAGFFRPNFIPRCCCCFGSHVSSWRSSCSFGRLMSTPPDIFLRLIFFFFLPFTEEK